MIGNAPIQVNADSERWVTQSLVEIEHRLGIGAIMRSIIGTT